MQKEQKLPCEKDGKRFLSFFLLKRGYLQHNAAPACTISSVLTQHVVRITHDNPLVQAKLVVRPPTCIWRVVGWISPRSAQNFATE